MDINQLGNEIFRLSALLEKGIASLLDASKRSSHAEHKLRMSVSKAWVEAPKGTVPQREAWVEAQTADEKLELDLADADRYTALEAVRSRRAQLSALQSVMAAHRAEVELAR